MESNEKLENDWKYFWNIPEIKTKWRDAVIEYRFFKKETTFDQFLHNTEIIYGDKSKLRKVEEKFYQIKCKFLPLKITTVWRRLLARKLFKRALSIIKKCYLQQLRNIIYLRIVLGFSFRYST